jgi:hypothetical protein
MKVFAQFTTSLYPDERSAIRPNLECLGTKNVPAHRLLAAQTHAA